MGSTSPPAQAIVRYVDDLHPHINFMVCEAGVIGPLQIIVPTDVSAQTYLSIAQTLIKHNQLFGRQDYIVHPRRDPFGPLLTVHVTSVHHLETMVERVGTAFCCLLDRASGEANRRSIVARACELGVQVNTWDK